MTKKVRRRKNLRRQQIKMLPPVGEPSAALLLPYLVNAARANRKR